MFPLIHSLNISNIQDAHQYTRCVNLSFHTNFNKPHHEHRICANRFSSDGIKMVLWEQIQRKNIQMGRLELTSSDSVSLRTGQQILHRNRCSAFQTNLQFCVPSQILNNLLLSLSGSCIHNSLNSGQHSATEHHDNLWSNYQHAPFSSERWESCIHWSRG
jgi:hypothetical protein